MRVWQEGRGVDDGVEVYSILNKTREENTVYQYSSRRNTKAALRHLAWAVHAFGAQMFPVRETETLRTQMNRKFWKVARL
eukprot:5919817-Amphidinium_carterae.1